MIEQLVSKSKYIKLLNIYTVNIYKRINILQINTIH